VGRSGDYSGILIPYVWPGENYVHTERLRRDHPEMEAQADGSFKVRQKYLGPPGRGNAVYFPPQVELRFVEDPALPAVVVEGEFKTLALWRLAWYGLGDAADMPAFLPVGLQGVFSWRGVVGKTEDSEGHRVDVKGPVPDLSRIPWSGRRVIILFDSDVDVNVQVGVARQQLTRELESRGAEVSWYRWPSDVPPELKGIDDFLAARGPAEVIRQLAKAKKVTRKRKIVSVADAIGESDWKRELICTDQGVVKSILANAITYLAHCPELASMLSYDEFSVRTMALQGTLKDFGIADILQLIGQQQKTGILHLTAKDQEVSIGFHDGNIVKAESSTRNKKDLIGEMLVRAEVITPSQLETALDAQRRSLKRLGDVLVSLKMITQDRFKQMVQLQATETLYKLFTWKTGKYEFEQVPVDVDQDSGIVPIRSRAANHLANASLDP